MILDKLVKLRKIKILVPLIKVLYLLIGVDIPSEVKIGNNVKFPHNSYGTFIHPNTTIKDNVKIYQNVTIGRSDIYNDFEKK